jgi:hypothetical protein
LLAAFLMRNGIGNCSELEALGIECVVDNILMHPFQSIFFFNPYYAKMLAGICKTMLYFLYMPEYQGTYLEHFILLHIIFDSLRCPTLFMRLIKAN